jgi:hypothetical protein
MNDIVDRVESLLKVGGYPMQDGYVGQYVRLFLRAYRAGEPMAGQLTSALVSRGVLGRNQEVLCEAWSHWWELLGVALQEGQLKWGDRD